MCFLLQSPCSRCFRKVKRVFGFCGLAFYYKVLICASRRNTKSIIVCSAAHCCYSSDKRLSHPVRALCLTWIRTDSSFSLYFGIAPVAVATLAAYLSQRPGCSRDEMGALDVHREKARLIKRCQENVALLRKAHRSSC